MNNLTNMTNLRLTKAVFIVLVMAMLSMQWSKSHIHLAEYHDHGGTQHLHTIGAHTHQSLTQNDNVSDPLQQTNVHDTNVVELDNHCNLHKWNSVDDQSIALTSVTNQLNSITSLVNTETATFCNSKRRYIDYSTLHLRAPPKLS